MDKRILYLKPGRLFTMLIGILLSASLSAHYNIAAKPSYTIAETTSPNPSPPPPTAVTGNWNIAATWTPNGVPGQGDDVTIPNGVTVTIDAAAVCKNITIEAGGTLIISGTNTLTVTGNWTNNGTFDAGLNGTVEFTGSLDAIISGTSTFKFLRFSKDAGKKVTITGSATTASGGNLTLASGSTEISGSLICNHNVNLTIPANVGITINGGTFSTTASIDNNGSFTFNAGTVTVGSVTGNSFFIGNNGTFSISGGTMNVAGRFQVSGGTANISGGTINLNSLGHNSSTIATLDLSLTANFTMTAGTINIVQPNSTGNSDIIIRNSSGTKNFAGGNINVGTGVSATYLITSQVPFPSIITATVNSSLVYRMLVSANGTYNFPLTTNAGSPLPASVTISGAYAAGAYIQISTNQVKHPENKNNSNYLNRFWTVTTSGITSPNYNITAAYADTDIFDDEGKIAVGIWGGSLPWTKQSSVNTTTNTISLTGITAIGLQITGLNSDPPTVNITANPSATICLGASTTLTANATGDPVITYSWSPVTGLSATNISNPVATPASTTTYTVIVTDGNGFTATENIQITVTPNNTVSAASSTPTLCINTPLTNITHTTTGATGIGAPSGLPAGVTASFAANTITISGTPTESGTFNYSIPLTGGCGNFNAIGTITVTPDNTVSVASSTPSLCINTPLTAITHTTTGATGIGASTGLPAGISASWAGNTITISGTPTESGTFNYSIPLTGGCGNFNAIGTITVTPDNTVSAASSTPTLCINTALTDITHTTTGAIGIGAATGLPAGVSASWASNTITISGTPTVSGTFNYSIPFTGGCGTVSATGSITVTPDNTVNAPSSTPTLCINSALTAITHNTTGATGIGAATGLPAGVSASWASNTITISGTPTVSGTFNYSIPFTGGCGTVSATGSITVTPDNTVSAASSTPTLCINTPLTAITHNTTGATGIGAPTGLPGGVSASWAGNTITISGTPTQSGTFDYSIPLTGGCGTVSATGTIIVTPENTVTGPETRNLCINTTLTAITHTTTGATGIGVIIGLPAGLTASFAGNTITISGTPSVAGTFNYAISLIGGCGNINATGTITVNPRPIPTITPGSASVCSASSGNIYTTETGMSAYTWTVSAGGSITAGQNTNQITVNWSTAGSQAVSVTYTDANGCTAVTPTILSITVNPTPVMTITNPAAVCAPGTVDLTTVIINSTVPIVTREYYTDAAATNVLANPSAVSASGTYYIKGITASGCFDIKPVTVTIHSGVNLIITDPAPVCTPATVNLSTADVTAGSTSGLTFTYWTDATATIQLTNFTTVSTSGTYYIKGIITNTGCYAIEPVSVTVNTTPIINSTATPNTKSICTGVSTNIDLVANVASTFSWTIGTITGTVEGASAGSGNSINQILTSTGNGGTVQYLVTPTADYGSIICTGPMYTITVTVGVAPVITTNPLGTFITCEESYLDFSANATGSQTMNIQWQISKNGGTTWTNLVNSGTTVQGANSNLLTLYIPKTTGQGEDYTGYLIRAIYSNSCGNATTTVSYIDVDKGTFINRGPEITSGVCAGGPVTLWAKSNAGQDLTAQWQRFDGTAWIDIGPMWGPTNGTLEPEYTFISTAADDGARFRINYSGKCGNQNSEATIVFLNTLVTAPNSCIAGGSVTFTQNGVSGGTWAVSGGGTITSSGVFTPTSIGCYSATYQRGGCIDTKNFVVFPATPSLSLTGGSASACGTRLPDIAPLPAVSGFIAEYAVQSPGGTLSAYSTLAAANALLTNTIGCWTIKARYRLAADCGENLAGAVSDNMLCAEATLDAIVFPPKPVLNVPANTCASAFALPTAPSYTGFTAQYSINGSTFSLAPTIPIDPGCYTITAHYILDNTCGATPAGADGGASCQSDPVSVVIFPPAPTAPVILPGCGLIEVTPPPIISGFIVQYSYDNGTTWETTEFGPSADNYDGYLVKTRYVLDLLGGCGSTPNGEASTISACGESPATLRIVDTTPPVVICPTPEPEPVCVNNGDTYKYTGTGWDAIVIETCLKSVFATLEGATTGEYTTLNDVEFNIGTTLVTWTASDGCNTASCSFDVVVNPVPVISNMTATICSGGTFSVTPENGVNGTVPGGTTYSWSAPSVPGITGTLPGNNAASISGTLVNTTAAPINVVYTVAPLSGDCGGASFTVTVTVNPVLICTITGPDGPLCPSTTHTYTAEAGMTGYTWSITGDATITGATDQTSVTVLTGSNCNGSFTLTLSYNDNNGCSSDCQKTVTIIDNEAPEITQQPQNGSFECSSSDPDQNATYLAWLANNGGATATDNCDNDLTWSNNSTTQPWIIDTNNNTRAKTVTFTVTDDCLNSTDTQSATFTITDDVAPEITCPPNVEEQIAADLCSKTGVTIGTPTATDNCSTPVFSYTLSGVTTGSGNDLIPSDQIFNVGITTVTYIATDAVGNTAKCEFTVWIKRLDIPVAAVICPPDPAAVTVNPDDCSADVTLEKPQIDDPCNSIVSVVHDSPIGTPEDPSGIYPIGITTVTWTITDNSGNTRECIQTVRVNDLPLVCPANITEPALPLLDYADIIVPPPTYSNTCSGLTLTYSIELTDGTIVNSPATGINLVTSPDRFYIGVTKITYTLTHATGTTESCSFTITVLAPPIIECPADLEPNTDEGLCSSEIDPGLPTLVQGSQPITWIWTINFADGSTESILAPFVGSVLNPGPPAIGDRIFPLGISTITWRATNEAGFSECVQEIEVIDNEQPTLIPPPEPFEECVENLIMAVYNSADPINNVYYNPDYPDNKDYYLFRAGSTVLNLEMNDYHDNCCTVTDNYEIRWRIDFDDGTFHPEGSGPYDSNDPSTYNSGQPSTFGADIPLWGDGIDYENREHTITYWIIDCNGNESEPLVTTITIKPRPQIIKN